MKKLGVLFIVVICFQLSYANINNEDSLFVNTTIDELQFADNLDSLLNIYYVQQSLIEDDTIDFVNVEDTIIPDFPDSIYIERLGDLPNFVNLSYNKVVRNFIHLYTHKKRDLVSVMLGLSEYYFPIFEEELDKRDLPHELKYLPVIESALNPRAVSRAGATGMWQFMYSTGKIYKLEINSFVDERRDPVQSTYAAINFLEDLYKIYGDWVLVIAAYNCGPGNVNKAIRRSGGKRNYWDIYYRLPRETRGYVPAFIAASYVMSYYEEHNIKPKPIDFPVNVDTILVDQELHLKQVAEVLDIPLQQLRDLNPQYRRDIIPAKKKTYPLRLPFEFTTQFIDLSDSIYNFNDSIFFNPKNMYQAPPKYSRYVPEPPTKDHVKLTYTVKDGDVLGYVADWYDVGVSDVKYWNNIRKYIRVGQKLAIYKHKNVADNYKDVNTMTFAQKQGKEGKTVKPSQKEEVINYPDDGNYEYYTVKKGDTLWDITKKFPGTTSTQIMQMNKISDAKNIHPGQKIRVKRKS
jgi:peptidoglycan lytic transglycosylase D